MTEFFQALATSVVIVAVVLFTRDTDRCHAGLPLGNALAHNRTADQLTPLARLPKFQASSPAAGPSPRPAGEAAAGADRAEQRPLQGGVKTRELCHRDSGLTLCRTIADRHLGKPLIVTTLLGNHRLPSVPVEPGTPVVELFALSEGVAAVSCVRHNLRRKITANEFFPGPFSPQSLETLDRWVSWALAALPQAGSAVA